MDHLTSYFLCGTTLSGKNHHYRGFHDCIEHQFGQLVLQHVRSCNPKFADLGIQFRSHQTYETSANINLMLKEPLGIGVHGNSQIHHSISFKSASKNSQNRNAASLAVLRECNTRHRRRTFQHNMKRNIDVPQRKWHENCLLWPISLDISHSLKNLFPAVQWLQRMLQRAFTWCIPMTISTSVFSTLLDHS